MGAVAAALKGSGFTVTGSDENVYPPDVHLSGGATDRLILGLRRDRFSRRAGPGGDRQRHSRGNPEVGSGPGAQTSPTLSLPEVLKEFFIRGKHSLVVTGTHGKTTTTSLLAWVFEHGGLEPGFVDRRHPEKSWPGRALHDERILRHRGRRIRHRLLRQALASSCITCRNWSSSTISSSITPTSSTRWAWPFSAPSPSCCA